MMNLSLRTLVIVAHPDDEVLGCGGTMARIAAEGGVVQTIFLTDGESSRYSKTEMLEENHRKKVESRRTAGKVAAKLLGSLPPKFYDLPDNQLDKVSLLEIVKIIEGEITLFQPSRVMTHFSSDLNIDHCKVHEAVLVATRPQGSSTVREVVCFELPSSTEWRPPGSGITFSPNIFIGVQEYEQQKLAALDAYASEMRAFPHPRSREAIESLMKWRGSTANLKSAEAFLLVRGIY
jgi:LmbE family N-acetylglucosaminyl deacetylase